MEVAGVEAGKGQTVTVASDWRVARREGDGGVGATGAGAARRVGVAEESVPECMRETTALVRDLKNKQGHLVTMKTSFKCQLPNILHAVYRPPSKEYPNSRR